MSQFMKLNLKTENYFQYENIVTYLNIVANIQQQMGGAQCYRVLIDTPQESEDFNNLFSVIVYNT